MFLLESRCGSQLASSRRKDKKEERRPAMTDIHEAWSTWVNVQKKNQQNVLNNVHIELMMVSVATQYSNNRYLGLFQKESQVGDHSDSYQSG